MKIIFIVDKMHIDFEPMGIAYLSAIAKRKGHKVFLVDSYTETDLISRIREISPDIIAYSISTVQARKMIETNRKLKSHFKFISIFGGAHPTFYPEMIEEEGVDIICRGEGEEAFDELLFCLNAKKDYNPIKNLWIKKQGGQIVKNDSRAFIKDLDSIPFPDRSIFDGIPEFTGRSFRGFLAGRGCPHRCSFCFNHVLRRMVSGKYVRLRSVNGLLEEIESLVKQYALEGVLFYDDIFGFDLKWLREFCEKYHARIRRPFFISTRADYLDEERVSLLSKAGCRCIAIGIEAGNDLMRNSVLNKDLKRKDILSAINIAHKYNIEILTQNIVGIPGETIDTVLDTISLNIKCAPEKINLSFFTPFPKLDLTQLAVERGEYSYENGSFPDSLYDTIALNLDDKENMRFLGCMIYTLAEFPFIFPLASFIFRQKNIKLKEFGKLFLSRLDCFLQKYPKRKTSKRFVSFKEYLQ